MDHGPGQQRIAETHLFFFHLNFKGEQDGRDNPGKPGAAAGNEVVCA